MPQPALGPDDHFEPPPNFLLRLKQVALTPVPALHKHSCTTLDNLPTPDTIGPNYSTETARQPSILVANFGPLTNLKWSSVVTHYSASYARY